MVNNKSISTTTLPFSPLMLITFVDENGVKGHHIVHMRDPPNKLEKHKKTVSFKNINPN